jgi:phage gp29-like protein
MGLAGFSRRIASVLAGMGSLLPASRRGTARRRVVSAWIDDTTPLYPVAGITPAKALAILQSADAGEPAAQMALYGEMLRKWPRLAAVEATRRLALTGLSWEILPSGGATAANSGLAADAAVYCRDTIAAIDTFEDVLEHLARGAAYGISLVELVWQDGRLVDLTPAPYSRLIADRTRPWRLCVRTEESSSTGVPVEEGTSKWIIHRPMRNGAGLFDAGLLRVCVLPFLAQNISLKDWLTHSQLSAMPIRIGQYETGTPESEKAGLLKMLQSLGTEAAAVFSRRVDVKLLESTSAKTPYEAIQHYCNTEVTILWLGQHLTTEIKSSGSRAAAEIHDRVREDLLVADIAAEARSLRRDLLGPLTRARFGAAAPVPEFRRQLAQSVDSRQLAETLRLAVQELGMSVPRNWMHEALGIPEARAGEGSR